VHVSSTYMHDGSVGRQMILRVVWTRNTQGALDDGGVSRHSITSPCRINTKSKHHIALVELILQVSTIYTNGIAIYYTFTATRVAARMLAPYCCIQPYMLYHIHRIPFASYSHTRCNTFIGRHIAAYSHSCCNIFILHLCRREEKETITGER